MNQDPADKEPVTVSIPLEKLLVKPIKLPEIPEIEPAPVLYDPEFIDFTVDEIKAKTDDELKRILSGELYPDKALSIPIRFLIEKELNDRSNKKDRRLNYAIFIVSTFAMASGYVFQPSFRSWISEVHQLFSPEHQIDTSHQSIQVQETLQKQQEKQPISSDSLGNDQLHHGSHSVRENTKSKPLENKHKKTLKDKHSSINQSAKN